jgi:chemotaxis protein methyltransferase CheR
MDSPNEYTALLETIHSHYGYDFRNYAESALKRRIDSFMNKRKINNVSNLETTLLGSEGTFEEFVQEMSVTVTEMFRDPSFYHALRTVVVPRLATYPFLKVWIAGCATGQEAYSMAILLREEGLLKRSVIYATDINQHSLTIAREGIYRADNMQLYTRNYQLAGGKTSFSEYYQVHYGSVMFDKTLRENIVFSPHNLAIDGSFNEFQLVICRNVLIYFNSELQNRALNLFHESLCVFGFIALGDKESLLFYENRHRFDEIDRKEKIYMKVV